jgi:hypothetical protein
MHVLLSYINHTFNIVETGFVVVPVAIIDSKGLPPSLDEPVDMDLETAFGLNFQYA